MEGEDKVLFIVTLPLLLSCLIYTGLLCKLRSGQVLTLKQIYNDTKYHNSYCLFFDNRQTYEKHPFYFLATFNCRQTSGNSPCMPTLTASKSESVLENRWLILLDCFFVLHRWIVWLADILNLHHFKSFWKLVDTLFKKKNFSVQFDCEENRHPYVVVARILIYWFWWWIWAHLDLFGEEIKKLQTVQNHVAQLIIRKDRWVWVSLLLRTTALDDC